MVKCKAVMTEIMNMNDSELAKFREIILARMQELENEDALGQAGQATVQLDQQAVGRLSRMDALQNQAMAKANHARRQAQKTRLTAALARLEDGEYGYCEDCGDDIATRRLELDPAAAKCIQCARG
ncbi:RNA polymerase-binding transcription factor DksA [Roseovarius litorisediminis]|uniref:RNA polymerase-binding transcription factor DksA n=2 Tax=Roseovarius litorisediminis TaxID=1312363 RepID=A0A1Y5R5N9_9RHOB|nr:RNA polymerase-binding transcription factor DksA [Roseovarius litorisediminis]